MSKLKQPIGATGSLSDLIVENFLRVNGVQGSENCRIAGILGKCDNEENFIPDLTFDQLCELVDGNDVFLLIAVDLEKNAYTIVGWSDNGFNKTATEPMTFFMGALCNPTELHIPAHSINPRMELFIDRIVN